MPRIFSSAQPALINLKLQGNVLCQVLQEELISNNPDEVLMDIAPYLKRCALEIIVESSMGVQLDVQHKKELEYFRAINTLMQIIHQRQLRPWYRLDFLFRLTNMAKEHDRYLSVVRDFTLQVIKSKSLIQTWAIVSVLT